MISGTVSHNSEGRPWELWTGSQRGNGIHSRAPRRGSVVSMRCLGERFGKIMPGKTLVSADDRLTRRLSDLSRCRGLLGMRAVAGSIALLMLLWVGAMSPHLVHHLADADQGQL